MSRTYAEIRADVAYIASLDWVTKSDEDHIHRLAADVPALLAEIERLRASSERPCPHGDPACPCQDVVDGKRDPCHYEDAAGPPATAAWPAP